MGAEARRGQLSAWLRKKKSGSAMLRVRQYNKRYFTLDFDTRTLYYASEADSHKVSSVIPFADLLDVKLMGAQPCVGDNVSECSKSSKTSIVRRMSSFVRKDEDQEQRSVSIVFKPAKSMELLCSTFFEAERWFEAFQDAMQCASSSPGDERTGDHNPHFLGSLPRPAVTDSFDPGAQQDPVHGNGVTAYAEGGGGAGSLPDVEGVEGSGSHQADEPPMKKSFLDFSAIQQEDLLCEAPQAADCSKEADLVCSAGVISLQASDFGFGVEDQASSGGGSSSRGSSPNRVAVPTLLDDSAAASPARHEPVRSEIAAPDQGEKSYQDRHAGLTLQERMANMNFSDDEDEDDS